MRNLLNFLVKYNYWFLFILLEVASFVLLFRFNRYQQSVFFTSANAVAGQLYDFTGSIAAYFHLKDTNEDLLDHNIRLEQRVAALEAALQDARSDTASFRSLDSIPPGTRYSLHKARVIKNSLNRLDNYLTLDRGTADSIRPEMGVVDANGVVGIVYKVTPHYALVLSLLNSKSSLSCKIQGSGYFGYLKWEGGDSRHAWLRDLPRHAEFSVGDTVVTSGYSAVFPPGLLVGYVEEMSVSHDGLSYLLKIRLATDFGRISDVRVIANHGRPELRRLESTSSE